MYMFQKDSCNKYRYGITYVYTYDTPWYSRDGYAEITIRGFYKIYKICEL